MPPRPSPALTRPQTQRSPPLIHFPSITLPLLHPSHAPFPLPHNALLFKTPKHITKPEIRNYITALYNLSVARIRTFTTAGEYERGGFIGKMAVKRKERKYAVVELGEGVDARWPGKRICN